mgnify:CR=1 FL=1
MIFGVFEWVLECEDLMDWIMVYLDYWIDLELIGISFNRFRYILEFGQMRCNLDWILEFELGF